MKKVVKFGGSSLANAKQFKKVADIIKADKSRRYVVPSAPGKRNDKDEKVTDMLYACYDAVAEGRSYKKILDKIKERYNEIIDGLDLNLNLDHEFDKIEENFLAKAGRDYAASRGEYLNGIVMANYLGYEFIDAAEVIFFDDNGNFEAAGFYNIRPKNLMKNKAVSLHLDCIFASLDPNASKSSSREHIDYFKTKLLSLPKGSFSDGIYEIRGNYYSEEGESIDVTCIFVVEGGIGHFEEDKMN